MVNAGWVFFPVFIGHLSVFFGEISIQIRYSFKIGLFVLYYGGFLIYLYSGSVSPSLDVWFADIFFHSVGSFYFHFLYSVLKKSFFCCWHIAALQCWASYCYITKWISYMYTSTSPLFWISFPFRSPQGAEWNPCAYTIDSH